MMRRRLAAPAALALVCSLLSFAASDAVAGSLYETGFEEPDFSSGLLNGQDGFSAFSGPGAAVISTSNPRAGAQGVEILGAGLVDIGAGFLAAEFNRQVSFASSPGENVVNISADVRLDGPSTSPDDLVSVNLTAYTPDDEIISDIYVSSSGEIFAYSDFFGGQTLSTAGGLGTYFNLLLSIDFDAQETSFFVDGSLLGTLSHAGLLTPDELGSVSLGMFSVESITNTRQYTGYVDNLGVTTPTASGVIPEPGSIVLTGLGGLGLAGAYRSRRRR
jgi:hypothetical protein